MLAAPPAGERAAGSADLPAPAEAARAAKPTQPLAAAAAATDAGAEPIDRADNADKPLSPLAPSGDSAAAALLSKQEAEQRLGGKVLAALQAKFNGCLSDIRLPDEHDMLF